MTYLEFTRRLGGLVREHCWLRANQFTQMALSGTLLDSGKLSLAQLRETDALWRLNSGGRFGFGVQAKIWQDLGGPSLEPSARFWDFIPRFGDTVGWRQRGCWIKFSFADREPDAPFLVYDRRDQLLDFPAGCMPFHSVLSSGNWDREFSPRDAWGEAVWDEWAEIWSCFAL